MGKDLKGKELGTGIRQRKDGMYIARCTDSNGKRREVTSTKLEEVIVKFDDLKYEIEHDPNGCHAYILDEWFQIWIAIYKQNIVKSSTLASYIHMYTHHVSPYIGGLKLTDIRTIDVERLIVELRFIGLGYSMRLKVKEILLDMFNKAIYDDFAVKNPAKWVKVGTQEPFERRILTKEEQAIFLEASKGTFFGNLFIVAICTGMRIGEIAALEVDDIDFDNEIIHVRKTLVYQKYLEDNCKTFHFEQPKTLSSKRDIPMRGICEEAIKAQMLLRDNLMSNPKVKFYEEFENLVFVSRYGRPLCTQTVSDAIDRILNDINLFRNSADKIEHFSPHCLRHTFATRCFEARVPIKTIQELLGHASIQMTMDLYTHVLLDEKIAAIDELNKYYDEIDTSKTSYELIT